MSEGVAEAFKVERRNGGTWRAVHLCEKRGEAEWFVRREEHKTPGVNLRIIPLARTT